MAYTIKRLDTGSVAPLKPVLLAYEHHINRIAFRIDVETLARHELQTVVDSLAGGLAAMVEDEDGPQGLVAVAPRDWESRFYPFPIGHLPVLCALGPQTGRREAYRRLLAWVNEEAAPELGLPHLSCRVPVEDIALVHALEDSGFRHMSTMVQSYWKRPVVIPREPEGWVVREAVDADWPRLHGLIRDILSSMQTRYTADPDLLESGTRALYEAWGKESRAKRFSAVNLVVSREGDEPGRFDGFAFARFNTELGKLLGGKTGELTISGIQPDHRGHGSFNAIVPALLAWLWDHGAEHCAMLTQVQNYGSLRTAQRTQNLIVGSHHCFHRWLGTGG